MPKKISGVLIDFPAAKDIFTRAVAAEVAIIGSLRGNDRLYFAPDEEPLFDKDTTASGAFGNSPAEYLSWCDNSLAQCDKIAVQIPEHRFLGQNRLPMFIAALAKANGLGVVSGTKNPSHFVSPAECCKLLGVYCWTVTGFYADYADIKFI